MMNLPNDITEKIKADAINYMHSEIKGMTGDDDIFPHHLQYAHQAGATEWAGKAQELVDALEVCAKPIEHNDANLALYTRQEIARRALAKYKEVTNG